ncbi:hypothetical protein QR680_016907 [Steinernema hermaphroditum]|uniref:F-box domain-containing protein n=1 Tax=Steinernema hermaphroditum TaxID=289476 RepID=A0AA39HD54_9BILA|nr:hypothetical protein QR680_016907 [Steinernema hermaphroditum]
MEVIELPTEVLTRIFFYVDKKSAEICRMQCRRFYDVIEAIAPKRPISVHLTVTPTNRIVNHIVRIYDKTYDEFTSLEAKDFFPTMSCRFQIQELSLKFETGTKMKESLYDFLRQELEHCKNVDSVALNFKEHGKLPEVDLQKLLACLDSLENVKSLRLKYHNCRSADLTKHFVRLVTQIPRLTRVNVNDSLNSSVFKTIVKMRYLSLSECAVKCKEVSDITVFIKSLMVEPRKLSISELIIPASLTAFFKKPNHLQKIGEELGVSTVTFKDDIGEDINLLVIPGSEEHPEWVILLRQHSAGHLSLEMDEIHKSILMHIVLKKALNKDRAAKDFVSVLEMKSSSSRGTDSEPYVSIDVHPVLSNAKNVGFTQIKTSMNGILKEIFPGTLVYVNSMAQATVA